jgi:hypothetical protein
MMGRRWGRAQEEDMRWSSDLVGNRGGRQRGLFYYPYLVGRVVSDELVNEDEGGDGGEANEVGTTTMGDDHIGKRETKKPRKLLDL